jgi:phosphoserine phosphatase
MPQHDEPNGPEAGAEIEAPVIELTAETLRGDVRDSLLSFIKAQGKAWPYMNETERRDLATSLDRYSYEVLKQACRLIATAERPSIVGQLKEYREKDGVEAKLKFGGTEEAVSALHKACGQEVLLVTSGFDLFTGEQDKAEAHVPPDQGDLGIGSEYAEQ